MPEDIRGSVPPISLPTWAYTEGPVENGGRLTGTVRFEDRVPKQGLVPVTNGGAVSLPEEGLLIPHEGSVQHAVVAIEGILQGKSWTDLQPTLVRNADSFVPHVQGARQGSTLRIINRDTVQQDIRVIQSGLGIYSISLFPCGRGQSVFHVLPRAGFVEVVCDGHDRVNAWVVVLENPYFAITDEDGRYIITDIPPGTYQITAWHAKLGIHQVQVEITCRGVAELDLTFQASTNL
jgi:hypothetical protein